MHSLAVVFFSGLMSVTVLHCVVTAIWALGLRRRRPALLADAACPKAAVVLCLRGTDPFLADCLKALLDQDYPAYDVRIVVDAVDDPAWQVVETMVGAESATNVRVEALVDRRETCSLKCSSLIQAVRGLDESYEIVAQIDADTIAHRNWLRELATPLADDRVGATTGNRWYMPGDATWGSLVRYAWNAAAVVQMFLYNVAWGGTLAIKTKVFRESNLLEHWARRFCEDTMLFRALQEMGLRVVFVPSLMMVNRESCSLGNFYPWMRRQLLMARLYHPRWIAVVGHGILAALATIGSAAMFFVVLIAGKWNDAMLLGAGFVFFQVVMLLLWPVMECTVRRIVRARGERTDWVTAKKFANFVVTNLVMQIIYPVGLLSAMRLREVEWRGVIYQIDGPWKIRLKAYQPFYPTDTNDEARESL